MNLPSNLFVDNPWLEIHDWHNEFVIADERDAIQRHNMRVQYLSNTRAKRPRDYEIHLDVYPEPYIGDPEAPVLLLNFNPGYKECGVLLHDEIGNLCVENLLHRFAAYQAVYPFYPISPTYIDAWNRLCRSKNHYKVPWWEMRLGNWIQGKKVKKCKNVMQLNRYDRLVVARGFFAVELIPYASKNYNDDVFSQLIDDIRSQDYSEAIVRAKLNAGCVVVIIRGVDEWTRRIPQLEEHGYYTLNTCSTNKQNSWFSPGNLSKEAIEQIDKALSKIKLSQITQKDQQDSMDI